MKLREQMEIGLGENAMIMRALMADRVHHVAGPKLSWQIVSPEPMPLMPSGIKAPRWPLFIVVRPF